MKFAIITLLAGAIAACSGDANESAQPEVGNETLAAALADHENFAAVSAALHDTGLAMAFDGTASYTVLAPGDEALTLLKERHGLNGEGGRAVLAAILRNHILPGALTPQDIETAIVKQQTAVSIRTMGNSLVRFEMNGDRLTMTDEQGRSANISGEPVLSSNGVVIPIDAVLKQP